MFKILKKADFTLLILLLLLGAGLFVVGFAHGTDDLTPSTVVIRVAGQDYGSYDLNEDREIHVRRGEHINKVIIKDGAVQITEASCHNKLCIRQGTIDKVNQKIICLPNRVMVEITGSGNGGEPDVISG